MGVGLEYASESSHVMLRECKADYNCWEQAHPSPNVLYVQVGNATLDNGYWGGDQDIPTPRPSYAINSTKYGPRGSPLLQLSVC